MSSKVTHKRPMYTLYKSQMKALVLLLDISINHSLLRSRFDVNRMFILKVYIARTLKYL